MRISDIEADLKAENLCRIQDAFQALVEKPDTIELLDNPDEALDLLKRVCAALAADTSIMPSSTSDFVQSKTEGGLRSGTYMAGAAVVRTNIRIWQGLLLAWTSK